MILNVYAWLCLGFIALAIYMNVAEWWLCDRWAAKRRAKAARKDGK